MSLTDEMGKIERTPSEGRFFSEENPKPSPDAVWLNGMWTKPKEEVECFTVSARELMERKIEVLPTLLEPLIPRAGIGAGAGASDTGKSMLFRQLCFCVATGEEFFCGFPLKTRYKRAGYVSSEDDETAISFLLNKQNASRGRKPEEVGELKFIFDTERLAEKLETLLKADPYDVIVIDAFLDLFGSKDVNQGNHVRNFLMPYSQLASKYDTCIIFIHHSGKRTESNEASKHNLLGSQAFEAKMRFVLELRTDSINPDLRHLCCVKGNYLPAVYKKESFELRFENFWFYNTGERAPLQYVKPNHDADVIRLRNEGKTYQQIADELGIASKGTISKIITKVSKVSNGVSGNLPGNNGN